MNINEITEDFKSVQESIDFEDIRDTCETYLERLDIEIVSMMDTNKGVKVEFNNVSDAKKAEEGLIEDEGCDVERVINSLYVK